ncbi:stromal membrane-associated protein 1-like [Cyanistes caeruleus]|uniref:stromal membrane-associated protein 1-like n=1 Tax=Cyanistes caeruleus TaxID=156563 RepID=UPI000CDA2D25|nr:stromal membrane-associated protein 1-like [Cyanistes caeruleus]
MQLVFIFFPYKPQKKEDQQSEAKASPKKSSEPTIDLLGLDGPAEASVTNGGTATVTALNDDLDIFGPMISNPLPAAAVPPAQVLLNITLCSHVIGHQVILFKTAYCFVVLIFKKDCSRCFSLRPAKNSGSEVSYSKSRTDIKKN